MECEDEDTSELWQAMPDMNVGALLDDHQPIWPERREHRGFGVLYVCRDWYKEAIATLYGRQHCFHFENPIDFLRLSHNAYQMHNNQLVKHIRIVVDLWDDPPEHAFMDPDNSNWREWQEILEEKDRGLKWHFPGLEKLEVDFESSELTSRLAQYYVDGGRETWGGDPTVHPEQPGFASFRETLKQKVRVKHAEVDGLADNRRLAIEMAREMMGLEVEYADIWRPYYSPEFAYYPGTEKRMHRPGEYLLLWDTFV